MKKEERRIMKVLNKAKAKLKEDTYQYNRYDAYNNTSIVEIKKRKTFYKNTMIEFDKYSYNLLYAKLIGKKFIYAVRMKGWIYVFNITELTKHKYDFKFAMRTMPIATEFARDGVIKKVVGYIHVDNAIRRYKADEK